ncbi:membrane protein, putative [Candidatus Moduliflexus flocculans]|uniref:Membrane protein, putative n=1 Tax=Candidatus Moduliflexus flocculans TaxID=1499966 RepID=A0A081BM72_9BACT|nr:membrane protein, putative [Candidatus Moduliflexus flocculans]
MRIRLLYRLLSVLVALIVLGILFAAFPAQNVQAADHPILYLFWGDGCPHCKAEEAFLQKIHAKYPELEMRWFEIWNHPEFSLLGDAMRKQYKITSASVPMTFIGNWHEVGYSDDNTTGAKIEQQIVFCIKNGCIDPILTLIPRQAAWLVMEQAAKKAPLGWQLLSATIAPRKEMEFDVKAPAVSAASTESSSVEAPSATSAKDEKSAPPSEENVQLTKRISVNVSKIGLPLFTLIIGGLDGFNPCAMWVLSFLLTLVLYAKSRTKILLIGGIFVVASGVIYFLFMIAWLNVFLYMGYVKYMRIGIAVLALIMGVINCKDFFFFKKGVSLTIPESAQPKLFKKMRKIVNTTAFTAMVLGTIALAVSANLIELLCTAGFPAIYTNVLASQNLSSVQYYLYLVLYNVIYVIPLAVIVAVFAWKMGGRKLSEREGRILKLISGVLMLTLGIIMLVKPELLTFG